MAPKVSHPNPHNWRWWILPPWYIYSIIVTYGTVGFKIEKWSGWTNLTHRSPLKSEFFSAAGRSERDLKHEKDLIGGRVSLNWRWCVKGLSNGDTLANRKRGASILCPTMNWILTMILGADFPLDVLDENSASWHLDFSLVKSWAENPPTPAWLLPDRTTEWWWFEAAKLVVIC